jgi:phosphate transport system substrate-binding protein
MIKFILNSMLLIIWMTSCKHKEPEKTLISPVTGTLNIWCDESLKDIISQQEDVFESAYKYAKINLHYAPESEVIRLFYKDSIDVMVVSHGIDSIDIKEFKQRKIFPRQYRFGKSAIAFIRSKDHKEAIYSYDQMVSMLKGGPSNQVFAIESNKSGIAREILIHTHTKDLNKNIYALRNKEDVISWAQNNPNGIGIIDWSAISDMDDPKTRATLEKISLVSIIGKDGESYTPHQENLNGLYPFTRDLYFVRRLGLNDVSLGFATFICEERGQKIMLKAGLLPEYQSERWVEFKGLKDIKVVE